MIIALSLIAFVAGVWLLEVGAERFIAALGLFARRLRAPESVVGLLTAGGEWEELIVVLTALFSGHAALAVGNIIGSCIANLIGSMPLGFIGRRPLVLDRSARVYGVVMVGATLLATGFLADGSVEPWAGGVLVAAFIGYFISVLLVIRRGWLRPPEDDDDDDDALEEMAGSLLRLLGMIVFGLIIVSVGAELVVQGAAYLARIAGLSDFAIGATVVAIGTTLPDKAISFIAGLRGQGGVVTANATGSNIFLLTLVLGLAALGSRPALLVVPSVAHVDVPLLVGVSVLVAALFFRAQLHRGTGIVLLALYVGYFAFALVTGAR